MGPWSVWLWRLLRNKRFRAWLLATAGPRALALFFVWLERVRQRQTAIGEADQVDGMFSGAIIDGERHVIVWKDDEPLAAYPPIDGDLAEKLRHHARRGLTRPNDLPTRRARRALRGVGGAATSGVARAGGVATSGAARAKDVVGRAAGGGAAGASDVVGRAAGGAARAGGQAQRLGSGVQRAAARVIGSGGKDRPDEERRG
ncbi:MAG TPA: hypothetical protein VGM91_01815 [Conexibacter sp.]|jgi:hypothetical protein